MRLLNPPGQQKTVDSSTSMLALRVCDLSKRYGHTVALDKVSLQIDAGETVGVIGPNGAGKSTLLTIIAGQQRPDSGTVCLGSARIDRLAPHEAARRGLVLAHQIPRPFSRMTVRQNLRVASLAARHRHPKADRNADVERILISTGLADKADRMSADITLLDRKRLGLARAMVVRPSLLLLDEVAAGLTVPEVDQLVRLIGEIRATGTAIAIVEHVDNVIRRLADRVVVLDWGRVVAEGSPSEIMRNARVREIYLGRSSEGVGEGLRANGTRNATARPLLQCVGVTARYAGPPALCNVDFTVNSGEIVALLGVNGSGKSTLARLISGVLRPVEGTVMFDGVDISNLAPHLRASLGISASPEGRRIFTDLTVEENLAIGAYSKHARAGAAKTKAWIYDMFPALRERAKRFGNELSGGQQQMLAIGRALMASPRLLVLDEATLGLAPVMIDVIYDAIDKIRERDVTVVLIEQAAYRALAIADHVYVLDHGVRTFSGSPGDLRDEAQLTKAYFGTA